MSTYVEKLFEWRSWSGRLGWTLLDLWRSFEEINRLWELDSENRSTAPPPLYAEWLYTHLIVGIRRLVEEAPDDKISILKLLIQVKLNAPKIPLDDYLEFRTIIATRSIPPGIPISKGSSEEAEIKLDWARLCGGKGSMASDVFQEMQNRLNRLARKVKNFTNGEITHHSKPSEPPKAADIYDVLVEIDSIYCVFSPILSPHLQTTSFRVFSQFGSGAVQPSGQIMEQEVTALNRRRMFWDSLAGTNANLKKIDWDRMFSRAVLENE